MRIFILFFIFILVEISFLSYYIPLLKSVPALRWSIVGISVFLMATLMLGMLIPSDALGFITYSTYNYIRAFLIIVFVSKLVSLIPGLLDLLRIAVVWLIHNFTREPVFNPSRSEFLRTSGIVLGLIPFASLSYGMIRNPYRYKLYRIPLKTRSTFSSLKGLKIVQISDIHSGSFFLKEPIQNAIDMINEQNADLVLFTGDIVNYKASELEPYLDLFSQIRSRYGVYSVLGNHDYGDYTSWESMQEKRRNFNLLCEYHERMGWRLLRNEHEVIDLDQGRIGLVGVENISAHRYFRKYGNLRLATRDLESKSTDLNILLSHDPSHWDKEVKNYELPIHLTCSGHTHGFQFGVEIPGFKWSPSQYFYKKWAGLYEEGERYLYVNRGFGFLGYPGRVGILPEITLIELV